MSDTNTAINTVSVDCPAKTNLTLHVGRPRSEWGGRHELDTIYCAVGVYDTVTTSRKKPGSGFSLNLEGAYLGDLASSGSDMRRNHAVLALFAKALPGSIRAFLMTLATVDDLLAIILIAVFFSSVNAWYWFVGIAVCAVVWYFLVRMRKVPWLAVAIVGILAWVMMFEAGVHPTLAGVLVGLLTPAHERFGEKTPRAERYADKLQPFSALLALPIFALFATGVHFESLTLALFISPVVVAVMVALVVGKPLGIMITAWLSTHVAGLKMAKGLRVRDMFPAACACGIGFTVSFLISSLAYQDAELSAEARFGVLVGSIVAAVISGILLSRQSKKFELAAAASSKHKHHTADEDAAGEVESVLEDGTVVVSQMIDTHPKVK